MLKNKNFFKNFKSQKGVTFIELTIVISIFSIIAGTLILNFSRFGRNITIQNLAQDIALQINSAQKEAISGRTNDLISTCDRKTEDCAPRYGIYIAVDNNGSSTGSIIGDNGYGGIPGKTLLTFFDTENLGLAFNEMLDSGGNACGTGFNTECLDNISLGQGNVVSEICVGFGNDCDSSLTPGEGIHITFKRPYPDAIIKIDGSGSAVRYNYARITVKSPNADTKEKDIVVTGLGQISIEQHIP